MSKHKHEQKRDIHPTSVDLKQLQQQQEAEMERKRALAEQFIGDSQAAAVQALREEQDFMAEDESAEDGSQSDESTTGQESVKPRETRETQGEYTGSADINLSEPFSQLFSLQLQYIHEVTEIWLGMWGIAKKQL